MCVQSHKLVHASERIGEDDVSVQNANKRERPVREGLPLKSNVLVTMVAACTRSSQRRWGRGGSVCWGFLKVAADEKEVQTVSVTPTIAQLMARRRTVRFWQEKHRGAEIETRIDMRGNGGAAGGIDRCWQNQIKRKVLKCSR